MTVDAPLDAAPVGIPANTLLTSPILPTLLKLALPNTVAIFGSTLVAVAALFRLARRREGGWSGAGVYRQAADGWHRQLVAGVDRCTRLDAVRTGRRGHDRVRP